MADELLNYFNDKDGLLMKCSEGNHGFMASPANDKDVGLEQDPQEAWLHLPTRSPLWMVTRQPLINEFVSTLPITVSRSSRIRDRVQPGFLALELEEVRVQYAAMIRGGEARLHRLGALVGNQLFHPTTI